MEFRRIREEQHAQSLPAGRSGVMAGQRSDESAVLLAVLQKRQENKELEERKRSLQQRMGELQKKSEEVKEFIKDMVVFVKHDHINQVVKKAERERKEGLEKEAEIMRLKEEYAQLMERKQELQSQVQRLTPFQDFMEQVAKMNEYKDVQFLLEHLENLLHCKNQLYQRDNEAQEEADQLRKALLTLEDQHQLLRLHIGNQLSQLHIELENMRSEGQTWESKWSHIQETATQKTLLVVQIKMVILNLYEMIGDIIEEEEGVDMNDIDKQLYKIKMFFQDLSDMVKHQTPSHKHTDGQIRKEQKRDKKHIATKKD